MSELREEKLSLGSFLLGLIFGVFLTYILTFILVLVIYL